MKKARQESRARLVTRLAAIADKYPDLLYGRCATFAIALRRLTGLPIYGLVGYDEETDTDVLIHAYVRDDDTRVDVKGPRDLDEITADFDNDPAITAAEEVPLTESRVAQLATGSTKCPTLTEVTPIAAAVWKIVQQLSN
jgi:hypothetical protein